MSVESKYEVLDEISHVIQRRNMYLGDAENTSEKTFIYNTNDNKLDYKTCEFNYGLIKIFDEILINAIDNLNRDGKTKMSFIRCSFDVDDKFIKIENNGPSIPIEKYVIKPKQKSETKEMYESRVQNEKLLEGKYIPEIIFTKLRSSSNYNKENEATRTTGGLNGVGAKLTVIFSKTFKIKIINNNRCYEQVIENNSRKINEPTITTVKSDDLVSIEFEPDWKLLDETNTYDSLNIDSKNILLKRLFDYSHLNLDIYYKDFKFPKLTYTEFSNLHLNLFDDFELYGYEYNNWKICFGFSDKKSCVISYVNNVPTYKNGEHVDIIKKQIATYVKKQSKNKQLSLKTLYPKLSLCIYSIIPGATFSSQAKTSLSNKKFSCPVLPESLLSKFTIESGILEFANLGKVKKENTKTTRTRITNIDKLMDAEEAGKPMNKRKDKNHICTLFICEGDSAQSLCTRGIKYLGEQYYGSFALRGKVLNTQKASEKKYLENVELTNLKKAIGLVEGKKYTSTNELRYQRIVCCKDADFDGSLIMGLLINFFYQYFRELILIPGFFCEFITPVMNIYKLPYNPKTSYPYKSYYNLSVFENDESIKDGKYYYKYIKGLGGNSDNDIEVYFKNFDKNVVVIDCSEEITGSNIKLVYSNEKGYTDKRKTWINNVTLDAYLPRDKPVISFNKICDIDLALASNDTCERSIPSVIDGLKPAQRKVIYTFFSESESKAKTPIKVFQLTGKVSDFASYHHGNQSLDEVIIKLAQDFVGANNINLIERDGQFGTRNKLGNDASATRYISAYIGDLTRTIYPKYDDKLLKRRLEDNEIVEPIYYVPIIPIILVNGCKGIGTGWSTEIPMFNIKELIGLTSTWLNELSTTGKVSTRFSLAPWYKNYKGKIYNDTKNGKWVFVGNINKISDTEFAVDEIPINMSIFAFRQVMNSLVEKKVIKDYSNIQNKNNSDSDSFNFHITFNEKQNVNDLYDLLQLRTYISQSNLVGYDRYNHITLFHSVGDIFKHWFETRLMFYKQRKSLIIKELTFDRDILMNKHKFISNLDKYDIKHKSKQEMIDILTKEKYMLVDGSYNYLLKLPIYSLTKDKLIKLETKIKTLNEEIDKLEKCSIFKLFNDDLIELNKML